jgi:hypothetical protein
MAKPRFLRRHYPHQVQGVRPAFAPIISARRLPRTSFSFRIRLTPAKSIRWIEQSLCPPNRQTRAVASSMLDLRSRVGTRAQVRGVDPALHGTMTAASSEEAGRGVEAGVGEGNADSPISSIKLESISVGTDSTGSTGIDLPCWRYSATSIGGCFFTANAR